jgi:hypothetical protein
MCRYIHENYRASFACLPCRHVAQYSKWLMDIKPRCPKCRADLTLMGYDFKAPRKGDDAGWRAVEAVIASGQNYMSCGCNGPGYRPATIAQVRQDAFVRPWVPRRNH